MAFSQRGPVARERAILLKDDERFMQRGIVRSCVLLIVITLCVAAGASSAEAQEPAQTREGIITTFAPIVEKVAPSVVTVFTTQTVSRG
ncbi:MAG: hypothetical protein DMF28_10545, partial [Verrucomicrobia bacterium]